MLLFNLQFRYSDENFFRPYVINAPFSELSSYVKRVSSLSLVAQINIDIYPVDPTIVYHIHEFTI